MEKQWEHTVYIGLHKGEIWFERYGAFIKLSSGSAPLA